MKTKRFNEQPYTYANNKDLRLTEFIMHLKMQITMRVNQMQRCLMRTDIMMIISFLSLESAEWFELNKKKEQTWKFHDQKPNQQLMYHR